jgi:DNA polymerase-3 subunit beta
MSFKIEKKVLYELLQTVFPIVPAKSSLQILSNLKISLFQDKIEVIATDLDHSIKAIAPLAGDGEYEITVNARKLFEIVRELHEGEIRLSFDDQVLIIESGESFSCKIACADSRDFPAFPEIQQSNEIDISVPMLKNMIMKSSFAVSKDELKACLCGVLWEIEKERIGMVATDGHRLGSIFYLDQLPVQDKIACIISPKSLLHLVRIVDSDDQDLRLHTAIGEKYVTFSTQTMVLCSKLIEGPYPDYEKVIPRNNTKIAIVDKSDLQNAVKRVSVLSNNKTHLVKFSFVKDEVEIMVMNREIGGEARQKVMIDYSGEDHTIGFNASYFSEILNMITTPKLKIEMNTQISACLLFPQYEKEEDKKSDNTFLIMPLRIMEEKMVDEY